MRVILAIKKEYKWTSVKSGSPTGIEVVPVERFRFQVTSAPEVSTPATYLSQLLHPRLPLQASAGTFLPNAAVSAAYAKARLKITPAARTTTQRMPPTSYPT